MAWPDGRMDVYRVAVTVLSTVIGRHTKCSGNTEKRASHREHCTKQVAWDLDIEG